MKPSFNDTITVAGIELNCIVGVYPHERDTPQPLRVDVELTLDTEPAAEAELLSGSIDYALMSAQLVFLLQSCRFKLLETAAHTLACYLLAPPALGERRAQVSAVEVRLTKPNALKGAGCPSLTIRRSRDWFTMKQEHKPFGVVDIIHETRELGVYRLNVAPGEKIPLHVHRQMQESEMVLTEGLWCQNKSIARGAVHRWPQGAAHCYENPTSRYQTILCVDDPPFIEEDEIIVSGAPAEVPLEPAWAGVAL